MKPATEGSMNCDNQDEQNKSIEEEYINELVETNLSLKAEDPTSNEGDDDELISDKMILEEEKVRNENATSGYQCQDAPILSKEEKFERLTELLRKSKVYSDYLLQVIDRKKEKEKKKALKREKKMKTDLQAAKNCTFPASKKRKSSAEADRPPSKKNKVTKAKLLAISQDDVLKNKLYLSSKAESLGVLEEKDGIRYLNDTPVPISQPKLFNGGVLRDYQVTGYDWLKVLYQNAINGILADEMGLGKTIQCIALICKLIEFGLPGPFLICVPMSTITNWISEFRQFAPSVPIMLYHGLQDERQLLRQHFTTKGNVVDCYPVVVTTYEILIRDRVYLQKYEWQHLIIDEGHRLKNHQCRLLTELKQLNVTAKVLLTGTPLQNNLKELWSLLNFIIPEVFDDLKVFESWFINDDSKGTGSNNDQQYSFITMLHEILAPFVLRRIKADVLLNLPKKKELLVNAPLSKLQSDFYAASIAKTIAKSLSQNSKEDISKLIDVTNYHEPHTTRSKTKTKRISDIKNDYQEDDADVKVNMKNVVMMLRKCCNHPYLIKYPFIPGTDIYRVDQELINSSGKFMLLDKMLPTMKIRDHRCLIFSQFTSMLTILEDYCRFKHYRYVRLDGSTKCADRQKLITKYNSDHDIFIFLLSTRAGGLGINLTSADSVIIYDSDWNPQNDLQAQDRCHRIGQLKPVVIYRFVTANTIDQKMVERGFEKRRLEKMVMYKDKFKGDLDVELRHTKKVSENEIMKFLKDQNLSEITGRALDSSIQSMTEKEFEELLSRDDDVKSNRWFKTIDNDF